MLANQHLEARQHKLFAVHSQACRRMDLWSQLPNEIEEHVLSFVPVPNLCRNRSVCKGWNRIISDPHLAALCVQNQSKEHAPFLILQNKSFNRTTHEPCQWKVCLQFCILDLSARRWYQHADTHAAGALRDVVDMDGGLVLYECWGTNPLESLAMAVYNPLDKTEEEVPLAPNSYCSCPLLNLVVDNIAQSFTIIRLEQFYGKRLKILNIPTLQTYNSATKEWKGLTNQWCKFETQPGDEEGARPRSSVVFQQCLYVLFRHTSRRAVPTHQIWRYDLLKAGSWENVSLLMDTCKPDLLTVSLIVSANRLFIVSGSPIWSLSSQFEVTEINICRMTCETVFAWTKAQALEVFDVEEDDGKNYLYIDVFGFDNSLMFMLGGSNPGKLRGKLRAFDFVTRKWDCEWPRHPLEDLGYDANCGKQMNFLLPGTPW